MEKIIDHIIKVEGSKFTNHPSDRGGPTKYGITQATLSRHRKRPVTAKEVEALTEAEARAIYTKNYITDPKFDRLGMAQLAIELIDSGVNVGVSRAATWLQRALNALNRRGRDYPDIEVDGDIGPATLEAIAGLVKARGKASAEIVLTRACDALQASHYITLAEKSPSQEDFVYGWLMNRVGTKL